MTDEYFRASTLLRDTSLELDASVRRRAAALKAYDDACAKVCEALDRYQAAFEQMQAEENEKR